MPGMTQERAAVSGWCRREVRAMIDKDVEDPNNDYRNMSDIVNRAVRSYYDLPPVESDD